MSKPKRLPNSVGWFVLAVVGGGFIGYLLDVTVGQSYGIEIVFRLILALQLICSIILCQNNAAPLRGMLNLSILLFGASILIPFSFSALRGADLELSFRTFYFMFGVGVFLLFFPFVPFQMAIGKRFKILAGICLVFGLMQWATQDILLSARLQQELGLEYAVFSNGKLRVVSFFSSAPRFAEFLVLVCCYVFYFLMTRFKSPILWLPIYGIAFWLLFNTYSRSGYILWVFATLLTLAFCRRALFSNRTPLAFAVSVSALTIGLVGLVLLIGAGHLDRLDISNPASLTARFGHWTGLQDKISTFGVFQILFGSGEAALYSRSELEYLVVDNVLIAFLLYGGLFGLMAFLLLFFAILRNGLIVAKRHSQLNLYPLLAFYLGLLFEGQFVDNHNTIFLTQFSILAFIGVSKSMAIGSERKPCARQSHLTVSWR